MTVQTDYPSLLSIHRPIHRDVHGTWCHSRLTLSFTNRKTREDFWQRDKWPGCFKVRWLVVKDVHNASLRHIRLTEQDKKPVTNSRDTQEVEPGQGMLVLNIFREYRGSTTLLDDFDFYGQRQVVHTEQLHTEQLHTEQLSEAKGVTRWLL